MLESFGDVDPSIGAPDADLAGTNGSYGGYLSNLLSTIQ
jgi:hypothetical protein